MGVEPAEVVETSQEAAQARAEHAASARLNAFVAVTVAVLATFMGICKVKDDNICQGMQQAQADRLDHWNFYQARNIRLEVARSTLTQLELARRGAPEANQAAYDEEIAKYRGLVAEEASKKDELKAQAEQDQKTYDGLNFRDDQFDLSDAMLAIAIAMLAVTALTEKWGLYWVAMVPTAFGVVMGVAGLGGLAIHPDALIKLLS